MVRRSSHRFAIGVLDGSICDDNDAGTTRKLKTICPRILAQCAAHGTTPLSFYNWVRNVGRNWRPDTEYNEGLNNKIKMIVDAAPRITLELLCARLALTVALDGTVDTAATKLRSHAIKWSDLHDSFFELCDDLVSSFVPGASCSDAVALVDYSDRIGDGGGDGGGARPLPAYAPSASASAQALVSWALSVSAATKEKLASLNVQWLRAWQATVKSKPYLPSRFVFGILGDYATCWRVVDTVGYVGVLCPCCSSGAHYPCKEPIEFTTSLDIVKCRVLDNAEDGVQLWYAEPTAADGMSYSEDEVISWVTLRLKPKKPAPKVNRRKAAAKAAEAPPLADVEDEGHIDADEVLFHVEKSVDAEGDFGLDNEILDALDKKDKKTVAAAKPTPSKDDFPGVGAHDPTESILSGRFHAKVAPTTPALPPHESVELSLGQGKKLFHAWRSSAELSRMAFEYRNSRMKLSLGQDWEMALVQYSEKGSPTVAFINFPKKVTKPSLSKAQSVRIDNHNRVVWSSVHFRPWRDFTCFDCSVLLPAVGASMVKATGWLREILPDEAARLHQMFQQSLAGGFVLVPGTRCAVCGFNDATTRFCPLCLQSVHPGCIMRVVHYTHGQVERPTVEFGSCMPRSFNVPGISCPMCSHFIST